MNSFTDRTQDMAQDELSINRIAIRGRRSKRGYRSRRPVMVTLAGVLALALTLAWDGRQTSAQSLSCGISEITFTTGGANFNPSLSGDGTRIAFTSNRDLTGGNAGGNQEIFLYDTQTSILTQVTNTTGATNGGPSISGDGTRIAFHSTSNLTGENADSNFEIFLYDTQTSSFTQVTNTTGGVNARPSLSGDGTRIAFYSDRNLTGGNADPNNEIFLYDTQTSILTQVTNTTGGASEDPSISGDGTRIAFVSTRDLTGGNADLNLEIFLYDTQTSSFTQVTNTAGVFGFIPNTSISGDGTRIAFQSNRYPSGNADGNQEIFLYDSTTGGIAQITFTTGGVNFNPSLSGDGTRIAFQSDRDLTGGNADGNEEIFLYDTQTSIFTQVTNTTGGGNEDPSISGDGTRVALVSSSFANLGNADGNREIFLASCLTPQPPSSADLSVSLGVDKTSVKQGALLTYTITVENFGPNDAAGVAVNDALSSGTTFVSAQANKGNFTTPPVGQSGVVTWNVGDLASGVQEAAQIQVTVIVRGRTTVTNTATVSSADADPNEDNNSASITTSVMPGKSK